MTIFIKKEIDRYDSFISIIFPYNPQIVTSVKDCPNRKWNKEFKQWESPLSSLPFLLDTFPSASYIGLDEEIQQYKQQKYNHLQNIIPNISKYKLHPKLYQFQKDVIKKAIQSDSGFGLFLEPGLGKTFCGLEIIKYLKSNNIYPALVICPIVLINGTWIRDKEKFEPELSLMSLRGNKLEKGKDIYVINYEQVNKYLKELKNFGFKVLIVDESSKLKNYNSQISRNITNLAENIPYTYCLSGTPAPNNQLEYYTQLKIIGATKKNFYQWRKYFFKNGGYMGYEWFFDKTKDDEFKQQFESKAIFMEKSKCLDLPPKYFIPLSFTLSKEELEFYYSVRNKVALSLEDNEISINGALAQLSKLRQICNGFMYYNGEENNTLVWQSKTKSKLNLLEELLSDINEQVIIWVEFKQDKKNILGVLENKYSIVCMTGEEDEDLKEVNRQSFELGKSKIMIANPKSVAHGLTFTNCHFQIYYSLSFSSENFIHSQERIHRIGQEKDCTYYLLQAEGTKDEEMYQAVKNKKKISLDLLRSLV